MPYIDGLAPGWVEDVAQVNLELELDANMEGVRFFVCGGLVYK